MMSSQMDWRKAKLNGVSYYYLTFPVKEELGYVEVFENMLGSFDAKYWVPSKEAVLLTHEPCDLLTAVKKADLYVQSKFPGWPVCHLHSQEKSGICSNPHRRRRSRWTPTRPR